MKAKGIIILAAAVAVISSCKESMPSVTERVFDRAAYQFTELDRTLAPDSTPRTFDNGKFVERDIHWWCSGFFPGSLWYVYQYTGDEDFKALAENHTLRLETLLEGHTDHDLGFQINCSYGNAFRMTGDSTYLAMYENAAAKLASRFNPVVGCIKSWDKNKYSYPVIIDNMMNLELLLRAAETFGCDSLREIAVTHALTTMGNHFRENGSSFHLVDYNPETGAVVGKMTVQGYADETSWSRGQAWGLYGYTMMYELTKDERFLGHAEKIAGYVIPMLPKDGVPYWDFNAPGTPAAVAPDAPGFPKNYAWNEGDPVLRDASAGAIIASALVKLSTLTSNAKASKKYLSTAEKIMRTFATPEYLAEPGENGGFLLKHSVGNLHGNSEVDVPLTYADYYYLEALIRYKAL